MEITSGGSGRFNSGPKPKRPRSASIRRWSTSLLATFTLGTTAVLVAAAPPSGGRAYSAVRQVMSIVPNDTTAYVADLDSGTVTPFDTKTNEPGPPIDVGMSPIGVAITPNGTTAYVANSGSSSVTPINIATNTPGTPIPVGMNPYFIAITPNGKTADERTSALTR